MTERVDAKATIEPLSDLVRAQLTDQVSPSQHAEGREQARRAMQRRAQRRQRRVAGYGLLAVAAAILLAFGLQRWLPAGGELSYEIASGSVAESGYIVGASETSGPELVFSDGSRIGLSHDARSRVSALTSRGARLALERGTARVRVVHRDNAEWFVDAGPFVIRVTGTEFDVDWSAADEVLRVDLKRGSVIVSGPFAKNGIEMRAGQRLRADSRGGNVELGAIVEARTNVSETPTPTEPDSPAPVETSEPPVKPAPAVSVAPATESWKQWVVAGEHARVLGAAKQAGLGQCYQSCSLSDLTALADAARYSGDAAVAEQALLAQRRRFLGSDSATTAAFLLGRLKQAAGGNALQWYDRYLVEAPTGPLASEALGRKMMLLRSRAPDQAKSAAREYLQRFPSGAHAAKARELLAKPAR